MVEADILTSAVGGRGVVLEPERKAKMVVECGVECIGGGRVVGCEGWV